MPLLFTTFFSLFLLWDYLKRGTVPLAFSKIKKEEFNAAEKILSYTKYPDRLSNSQKSYYALTKGFIERNKNNFNQAEELLLQAKNGNIKKDNERAMLLLALADINMVKGKKQMAKEFILQMQGLKVAPNLMDAVRKMQSWLDI